MVVLTEWVSQISEGILKGLNMLNIYFPNIQSSVLHRDTTLAWCASRSWCASRCGFIWFSFRGSCVLPWENEKCYVSYYLCHRLIRHINNRSTLFSVCLTIAPLRQTSGFVFVLCMTFPSDHYSCLQVIFVSVFIMKKRVNLPVDEIQNMDFLWHRVSIKHRLVLKTEMISVHWRKTRDLLCTDFHDL